eukprot:676597-Pleurochrysis_carterae.AAC.1
MRGLLKSHHECAHKHNAQSATGHTRIKQQAHFSNISQWVEQTVPTMSLVCSALWHTKVFG